jgi:hypothetical protein
MPAGRFLSLSSRRASIEGEGGVDSLRLATFSRWAVVSVSGVIGDISFQALPLLVSMFIAMFVALSVPFLLSQPVGRVMAAMASRHAFPRNLRQVTARESCSHLRQCGRSPSRAGLILRVRCHEAGERLPAVSTRDRNIGASRLT